MSSRTSTEVAPLAPDKVRGVLADLERRLDLRPGLVNDPLFMLTVRLALTAASPASVAQVVVLRSEPPEQDNAWEQERETLLRQLQAAVDDADRLNTLVANENTKEIHYELRKEITRWEAEAKKSRAEAEEIGRAHTQARAEATNLRSKLEQAQADMGVLRRNDTNFRSQLKEASALLARIEENEKKGEQARKSALTKVLDEWEWSAGHREYTLRKTRKPVPSCPVCGQMDPDRVQHAQSGHTKRCWFPQFRKQVLRTLG